MMSTDKLHIICDRCGESYFKYADDPKRVLTIYYKTIGDVEIFPGSIRKEKVWREIDLCPSCQDDLRKEFYKRGLMGNGAEEA